MNKLERVLYICSLLYRKRRASPDTTSGIIKGDKIKTFIKLLPKKSYLTIANEKRNAITTDITVDTVARSKLNFMLSKKASL